MIYKMLTRGGTRGSVTKRNYAWTPGRVIDAPKGEFYHLPRRHYDVETTASVPEREVAAHVGLTKKAKGGGWYAAMRGDVEVFKRQSEEEVDRYIKEHT